MTLHYDTELESDVSFDCARYYDDRSQWAITDMQELHEATMGFTYNDKFSREDEEQNYCFSAAKLKKFELAQSFRHNSNILPYDEENLAEEYDNLVNYMNLEDPEFVQKLEKKFGHFDISQIADEVINNRRLTAALAANESRLALLLDQKDGTYWDGKSSPTPEEIDQLMETVGGSSIEGNLEKPQLQCMVDEHLQGFGEKRPDHWEPPQEDQNRKRRLCRHFLKGHCKRGKACDFLHDSSIFCPDLQKVFLGGLPSHIVETTLRQKLLEQGYHVINKPKVLRGFTPQVCLGSVREAQRLIEQGKILIDGAQVDVRPYEAFAKDNLEKKLPDDIKRSVFLGGLPNGTTGQMIKEELKKMDVKVVNHPLIKAGFTPQVMLGSVAQAQMLVNLKKVSINETLVDVRPYVNFRERSSILGSPSSSSRRKY